MVLAQAGCGEAGTHVERGQQGQSDAGALRRPHQRQGHLRRVGVGSPAHITVQVVKLAYLGVAARQQFGIQLAGNGLELFGRNAVGGGVHAVAPSPEVITGLVAQAAPLGQTGNGALEGMAVRIDQAGQHRAIQPECTGLLLRRRTRLHLAPGSVGCHLEQDVAFPPALHPGTVRNESVCYFIHSCSRTLPGRWRPFSLTRVECVQHVLRHRRRALPPACRGFGTSPAALHGHAPRVARSGA